MQQPFPLQDDTTGQSPIIVRNMMHGFIGGTDVNVVHGVLNDSFKVQADSGLTLQTEPGVAFVPSSSGGQGVYSVYDDAGGAPVIAAAHASLGRRDLVLLVVHDDFQDSSGLNDAEIVVVTGTPHASPSLPSTSSFDNFLVLAEVTVGASVSTITNGNIVDRRWDYRELQDENYYSAQAFLATVSNSPNAYRTPNFTAGIVWDPSSMHSAPSSASRYTVTKPGIYDIHVSGQINPAAAAPNAEKVGVFKNGVQIAESGGGGGDNGVYESPAITIRERLVAGDYIEAQYYQSGGSTRNILNVRFSMRWSAPYSGKANGVR